MAIPGIDLASINLARMEFMMVTGLYAEVYKRWAVGHTEEKKKADAELARLKKIKKTAELGTILFDYQYNADTIRHSKPPWLTVLDKGGDCNDSMMLLDYLRPGGWIYAILRIKDGKWKDYNKWHFVYQDKAGFIWSNFICEGVYNIKHYAWEYWENANYLVKMDSMFNLQQPIIEL